MANDVVYVHHRLAEHKAFRTPTGMVGQWTAEQATKVAAHAALLAPKPGQSRGYATGETASSIRVKGPTIGRSGPEAEIVADTDHSLYVHEGTAPHVIRPRLKKQLMFFWRKAGRVVLMKKVNHPGTPANPFLVRALRAVFGGPGR